MIEPKNEWWRPDYAGGFFGENYIIGDEWYDSGLNGHRMTRSFRAKREGLAVLRIAQLYSSYQDNIIVDCPCGYGRLFRWLLSHGSIVFGVDINRDYLHGAIKTNSGERARIVNGDMRRIPLIEGSATVVANMWTSFGYFRDEEDDRRVLWEWNRILKPGGVVIVHTNLNPRRVYLWGAKRVKTLTLACGGELVVNEIYQKATNMVLGEWVFSGIEVNGYNKYGIRVWSEKQWRDEAHKAGFEVLNFFGSLEHMERDLSQDDDEFVVVLAKAAAR